MSTSLPSLLILAKVLHAGLELITFLTDKMFLLLAEVLCLNLSEGKDRRLALPARICHSASDLVRKIMDVDLLNISYLHQRAHGGSEKGGSVNTVSLPVTVSLH